ncbi:hypothetical protein HJG60_010736 [Phyllostomus discolor]|uniref:Uncharacterized protein n=1 Tax=Phyllostomus discolor TaxID=89673 RepID=A0A834EA79_9CHIR|nr:hypothetical protein HJG60_010736 [Phyllostomus discolor]
MGPATRFGGPRGPPIATFLYGEEPSLARLRCHGNPPRCKVDVLLRQSRTLRLAQRGPSLTGVRGDPFPVHGQNPPFCKPQPACLNHGGVSFVKTAQGKGDGAPPTSPQSLGTCCPPHVTAPSPACRSSSLAPFRRDLSFLPRTGWPDLCFYSDGLRDHLCLTEHGYRRLSPCGRSPGQAPPPAWGWDEGPSVQGPDSGP